MYNQNSKTSKTKRKFSESASSDTDLKEKEPSKKRSKTVSNDDVEISMEDTPKETFREKFLQDILDDKALNWESAKISENKRIVKIHFNPDYRDKKYANGLCRSLYLKWNKSTELQAIICRPAETPFEFTEEGPILKLEFKEDVRQFSEVSERLKNAIKPKPRASTPKKILPSSKSKEKITPQSEKNQIAQDIIGLKVFDPTLTEINNNVVTLYLYDEYKKKHSAKEVVQCIQNKHRHTKDNTYGLKKRLVRIECLDSNSNTLTYHNDDKIIPTKENAHIDLSNAFKELPLFPRNYIGKNVKHIIDGKVFSSLSLTFNRRHGDLSLKENSPFNAYEAARVLGPKINTLNEYAGAFYITHVEYLTNEGKVRVTYAEDCPNDMKTLESLIALLKNPRDFYYNFQESKKHAVQSNTVSTGNSNYTMYGVPQQTRTSSQIIPDLENYTEMEEIDLNKPIEEMGFIF